MTQPTDIQTNQPDEENFWKQHINLFKTSGLSRVAYCRENNLICHQFKYWQRKLQPKNALLIPIKIKPSEIPVHGLPVLCSVQLNTVQRLYFHDIKSVEYVLQRFIA